MLLQKGQRNLSFLFNSELSTSGLYYTQIYFYGVMMEVKSVYLDLKEGKKNGNVWMLESEAFKDPIEIKIVYDNQELAQFNSRFEEIENKVKLGAMLSRDLGDEMEMHYLDHKELKNQVELQEKVIQEQGNKISEQKSDLKELYKIVADLKTTVEMQSGTILHLQDQVRLLEKKAAKQPMVIHNKCFISGHESSGLGMVEIGDGDYLLVMNIKIGEHNEYVENKDELIVEKIHVEGQHYIPFYKLEGGTELDKPTATIYYDLVFIAI